MEFDSDVIGIDKDFLSLAFPFDGKKIADSMVYFYRSSERDTMLDYFLGNIEHRYELSARLNGLRAMLSMYSPKMRQEKTQEIATLRPDLVRLVACVGTRNYLTVHPKNIVRERKMFKNYYLEMSRD